VFAVLAVGFVGPPPPPPLLVVVVYGWLCVVAE
jgi:hypothetical protein